VSSNFARGTPMQLCLLYLEQAASEAERAVVDPQRWFAAVPDMHRALNCALVAALAGTDSIGAYPEKIRRQWLLHFEHPDWPDRPRPRDDRVESFSDLLRRAQDAADPWMEGRSVHLTQLQQIDLALLTDLRDDMEHVKPRGWGIEASGMPRILAAAADAIEQLLQEPRCRSSLTRKHEASGKRSIRRIRHLAEHGRPASRRRVLKPASTE
jgi:hypothetical protein